MGLIWEIIKSLAEEDDNEKKMPTVASFLLDTITI